MTLKARLQRLENMTVVIPENYNVVVLDVGEDTPEAQEGETLIIVKPLAFEEEAAAALATNKQK